MHSTGAVLRPGASAGGVIVKRLSTNATNRVGIDNRATGNEAHHCRRRRRRQCGVGW